MIFQIFFGMSLSYLVLPGILTAQPISFIDSPDWFNLLILGLFNIFDTLGRTLGGVPCLMISINKLPNFHIFAFSRVLIVLLAIFIEIGMFTDMPEL